MHITTIKATNIRNFHGFDINPSPQTNLLFGENGSGKTSFLEAIHLLSLGRSFRTHLAKRVIRDSSETLSVFALLQQNEQPQPIPLGIEKTFSGETRLRISGDNASIAQAAGTLPVILLNNDSFLLLTAGPKQRRQFIDWGLFHVKHLFLKHWKQHQQSIKQRNAVLRREGSVAEIKAWDEKLIESTEIITKMRVEYIAQLLPTVRSVLDGLLQIKGLEFSFYQGWPREQCYQQVLECSLKKDLELGYTFYGSHRADLHIKINKNPAQDILSRGQQKVLVWAMRLAQGILLKELKERSCIYLLDDLPSELDLTRREAIGEVLKGLGAQLFVTGIEQNQLEFLMGGETKMFHVKHNEIFEKR